MNVPIIPAVFPVYLQSRSACCRFSGGAGIARPVGRRETSRQNHATHTFPRTYTHSHQSIHANGDRFPSVTVFARVPSSSRLSSALVFVTSPLKPGPGPTWLHEEPRATIPIHASQQPSRRLKRRPTKHRTPLTASRGPQRAERCNSVSVFPARGRSQRSLGEDPLERRGRVRRGSEETHQSARSCC